MEPVESARQAHEARSARTAIWMRGLFMLVVILAFGVAESLLFLIALVQFLWLLSTEEPNRRLASFGKSLALWLAEAARFLSCATDEKPFPWGPWPRAD